MMIFALASIAGCSREAPVTAGNPLFCDIEHKRTFSQQEADWRAQNAPENLRFDLMTNEAGAEYCGWKGKV